MAHFLSILLFIIFTFLSGLHFYWLFGGRWALDTSIPTTTNGKKLFMPGPWATIVVASALMFMGLLYLIKQDIIAFPLPNVVKQYSIYIIAFVFISRAIGEFKYIGFFKKVKNTPFAQNDTKYYSPLCLIIGVLSLLVG